MPNFSFYVSFLILGAAVEAQEVSGRLAWLTDSLKKKTTEWGEQMKGIVLACGRWRQGLLLLLLSDWLWLQGWDQFSSLVYIRNFILAVIFSLLPSIAVVGSAEARVVEMFEMWQSLSREGCPFLSLLTLFSILAFTDQTWKIKQYKLLIKETFHFFSRANGQSISTELR